MSDITLQGYVPIDDFESDGCTMAPDDFDGVSIYLACRYHDWHYTIGGDEKSRLQADRWLRENMILLGADPVIAGIFFRRVRFWGVSHFAYTRGRKPGVAARAWLLVARIWQ